MNKNPSRHPAQADAAASLSLWHKTGRYYAGSYSTCTNETGHDIDSIMMMAGLVTGEYDVASGMVTWPSTINNFPGLSELSNSISIQVHFGYYTRPDAELAQEALNRTIRDCVRTEVVLCSKITATACARHRFTFTPLIDTNLMTTKVLCLLQDISETLYVSQDTQRIQKNTGRIAETTQDVLFRLSLPDNTYEHISPAVQEVTGYPPQIWHKNPDLLLDIIRPAWRAKFNREFRKFLHNCGPAEFTFPILHQRGEIRWIHLRTSTLRDNKGNLLAIEGIASDITERKMEEMERNQLIRELKKALAEVKVLSGLLPICSFCKKVRDDQGYWKQIELYITEHSELFFTHGLCPDCLAHHYPEYSPSRSAELLNPEL